jgi:exonuclease VII small subunit
VTSPAKDRPNGTTKTGDAPTDVAELTYAGAGRELDAIIEEFETGVVDVDRLVDQLERATQIVDELDRRLRRTRMRVEELVPRLEAIGRGDQPEELDDGSAELGDPEGGDGPRGLF